MSLTGDSSPKVAMQKQWAKTLQFSNKHYTVVTCVFIKCMICAFREICIKYDENKEPQYFVTSWHAGTMNKMFLQIAK